MRIEIATYSGSEFNKLKGDLLEGFAVEFVKTQGLKVVARNMRTNFAEIDLLCVDEVSGIEIAIECKGARANVPQSDLTKLVGVVFGNDTPQGWLISTAEYSKDAKGFKAGWSKKTEDFRSRFKFYEPTQLMDMLVSSRVVCDPKFLTDLSFAKPGHSEIEWVLLLTELGRFWTAPIMSSEGLVSQVFTFNARDGTPITDQETLQKLSQFDSSWEGKKFVGVDTLENVGGENNSKRNPSSFPAVIEIATGTKWSDFRPARLQDFVGRKAELASIQRLFDDVRSKSTESRVFAVTGDSGIGKSSLLTSIKSRTQLKKFKDYVYVMVIDCRAARTKDYIFASLVKSIEKARLRGFGDDDHDIEITNPADPLSSASVQKYLKSLERKGQVLCVVFDQFEEIYSKTELSDVFSAAESLFLSVIAARSNVALGFAWRTNITLPQEHPAYHMWHKLKDHRIELSLRPLSDSEIIQSVTLFEAELAKKLSGEIRRQLVEASAGYPWRLKKFCTYVIEQYVDLGKVDSLDTLDVEQLFKKDFEDLSEKGRKCLKEIAKRAPVDAHEITENYGEGLVAELEQIPLLKRSGSSLSIYWDVFRDFLNTGEVLPVPFSYMPISPSISSMLSVASELRHETERTVAEIAQNTQLSDGSVRNVISDLMMFGVACGSHSAPKLNLHINENDPKSAMRRIREVMERHSLTREIKRRGPNEILKNNDIAEFLYSSNSIAAASSSTVQHHARRLPAWLAAAGYLRSRPSGWSWLDSGDVDLSFSAPKRSKGILFGHSTPARALEVLTIIQRNKTVSIQEMEVTGYRNALSDLSRFGLVVKLENTWKYVQPDGANEPSGVLERLWEATRRQESVKCAVLYLRAHPYSLGVDLGTHIVEQFGEKWDVSSKRRNGNSLKRWSQWIIEGEDDGVVPIPEAGQRGLWTKKTPEKLALLKEQYALGVPIKKIASLIGITEMTARRWLADLSLRSTR